MQSGEGAVPAKETASAELAVPEDTGKKLTPEQLRHIREKHISIDVKDDQVLINMVDCCTNENDEPCGCPAPKSVSIFYCRRPPC